MARYNVRDLIGHFVAPRSAEQKMCPHACCRNKRVHPDNYPVVLPSKLLRRASEQDLAYHFEHTESGPARDQVLAEMERRDTSETRRQAREERRQLRQFSRKTDRYAYVDQQYQAAEAQTRGHMLNKRGRAMDVDPKTLFTGSERRARAYASEELLNYWADNPRPTAAMFEGANTRVDWRRSAWS